MQEAFNATTVERSSNDGVCICAPGDVLRSRCAVGAELLGSSLCRALENWVSTKALKFTFLQSQEEEGVVENWKWLNAHDIAIREPYPHLEGFT